MARIVGKRPRTVRVLAHRGLRRLAERVDAAGCNAMSDDDALDPDMHPLPGPREATPPTDEQHILERPLEGRLNPGVGPADQRLTTEQRPTSRPGPTHQHRP